jgi:23S rRNA (uracil1939-C5)-methyltransferase
MSISTYNVKLDNLVYGGDALGRLPDGRAVFVPYGLPGETVRLRIVEEKAHHARAELLEVMQASPQRIAPRCVHFGACGGCHYQHMAYSDQLAAKTAILKDQLQRLGGLADVPVRPAVASPQEWNYRNAVQFHLNREGRLGYHRAGTQAVLPIQECFLPEPSLADLWPQLVFEPKSGISRLNLRLGMDDDCPGK